MSRSLDPDRMQTLNVMTKDGSVAQLIVKRRDPKSKSSSSENPRDIYSGYRSIFGNYNRYGEYRPDFKISSLGSANNYQNLNTNDNSDADRYPKSVFANWIPIQSVYYQPKILRLDTISLVKNSTSNPYSSPLGNVIDSDRYVCYISFIF